MTVDADVSSSADLFGKSVTDLQQNILVSTAAIGGTLKYVSDYTGYSEESEEQSGNYIAIHCDVPDVSGVTIEVSVIGGASGSKTPDSNGYVVCRITSTSQKIRVVASKTGVSSVTREYALTGLTLLSA